jgi:hypothetical protein
MKTSNKMKASVIYIGLALFVLSCQNNNPRNNDTLKHCKRSLEVINGDTLNILGCEGRQGIWVPQPDNGLKDTVFFKNGKTEPLPAGWNLSNNYTCLRQSGFKE